MADKRIKGITIVIDGETQKLNDALKDVNKEISKSNAELKDLRSALKLDPKNTELLAQKQEVLAKEIKATTDRLNTLKETQRQLGDYNQLTDEQKENYRALTAEIARTESQLKDFKNELKETGNFDLNKLNDSLSGIRDTTGKIVANLAKVGTAIGGALTALGVSSIKTYAEYEQLVGGVESMFGGMQKGAEQITKIQRTAQNAWKDLTLSQNDYYKMFTSSYPLVKSSIEDENEAIEVTNRLLRLNSDLANTFGYDITTASTAVNWALKGSFNYIDNLNIGIKGTKEGFLEAAKNCGYVVDSVNELSSSDILDVLEQYANKYGVLGKTAEEASTTIQGSTKMLKSSWDNLKLAVADDNIDMGKAVDDFVDSVVIASKNIVPRIRTAIDGIKKLFDSLVRDVFPKLKREIPELRPLINVFEWFIDHKNLVITAIKGIIGVFAVTKIVDFATKVQNVSKALMTFASGSVAGAMVTAVVGITAVVTTLATIFDTETEAERKARLEMEKHTDILNDNVSSWEELEKAKQESLNKSMSEISYYENLYRELQSITDENGKVKDGYEKRAEFITTQLSEALGIEIELTDGVIKNNQEIADSIDKILEKKKAEALINSQTQAYTEAKAKEAEAYQDMIYWQQKYAEEYAHYQQLMDEGHINLAQGYKTYVDEMKQNYDTSLDQYNKYVYTIGQYEGNLEAIHNEEYDKIETRSWEYVKTLEEADNAQIKEIQDTISRAEYNYKYYNDMFEKTGEERWKIQRDNAQRILDSEKDELQKYVSEFNNQRGAMQSAGVNFLQGAVDGLNSKKSSVFNAISNIGKGMLDRFKSSLKEQSPSKATREMGQYLIQGISLGLKDDQNALLNQVDSLGNSIINGFYDNTITAMNGLGGLMSSSLNPTINPSVAYDLNYQLMANAMKEALQEVDVELDDRAVGKFIDKTVSEEVFN